MIDSQQKVEEFHEASGATIALRPVMPSLADRILRVRLIKEELDELDEAFAQENLVEVADALADLLYVVLGTAVTCGLDMEPIFNEVHRSNMTKFSDGHCDPGGKWIKGPSYEPANVKAIVKHQLNHT